MNTPKPKAIVSRLVRLKRLPTYISDSVITAVTSSLPSELRIMYKGDGLRNRMMISSSSTKPAGIASTGATAASSGDSPVPCKDREKRLVCNEFTEWFFKFH